MKLGDLVCYSGNSWFSKQIKKADKSVISHIGIITAMNTTGPNQVTEALSSVKTRTTDVSFAGALAVYTASLKALTYEDRRRLADYALFFSGESYGYADIGLQLGDALTHSRFFTSKLGPHFDTMKHPICSFVGAETYQKVLDYSFGVDVYSVTPADIYKWVTAHCEWEVEKVK